MKKAIVLLLALIITFSFNSVVFAKETTKPELDKDLIILYTNDIHCSIEGGMGYAGLAALKKQLENDGNYVLLVDSGDAIQGEPIGTISKGSLPAQLMQATGYDLAIPGNHEFDYGMDTFLSIAESSPFPYISANFRKGSEHVFDAYKIFDFNGVKIAFVGATTPTTITSSTPAYFQDTEGNYIYNFCQGNDGADFYAAVQAAVDAARAEGADYVFLLSHLGITYDCSPYTSSELIVATAGIDAVLDGHSHSTIECERIKNAEGKWTLLTQTGTKFANVGMLLLTKEGNLTTGLLSASAGKDKTVLAAIEAVKASYEKELNTVIAHTDFTLTTTMPDDPSIRIIRNVETNLGNLCADAYRAVGNTDIAFINAGGIRASIEAGDITYGDILNVHPFGNVLTVVEASGQQVLDCLEWGARITPEEHGGFQQVSGLTYEIHTYLPSTATYDENAMFTGVEGEYRVKNVLVNGEPLDLEKTYTVASHSHMLNQAVNGFTMFTGCNHLDCPEIPDSQILSTYIVDKLNGIISEQYADPFGEGRITIVDVAPDA